MTRKMTAAHGIAPMRRPPQGGQERGFPLPLALRHAAEALFGADFSEVQVHVGPEAERIGALAFTIGADIYFAPHRYAPHTREGVRLLGHELTHVVQQRTGRARNPHGYGIAVVRDQELEAEADRMGELLAARVSGRDVVLQRAAVRVEGVVVLESLDPEDYARFLGELRETWAEQVDGDQRIVVRWTGNPNYNEFLFRPRDLYLVGVQSPGADAPRMLGPKEENYNRMKGAEAVLSKGSFQTALSTNYTKAFDVWSASLRQVILVTAEAAKSYTVEYLVKKVLRGKIAPSWEELKVLLTNWDKARMQAGLGATTPLEVEHYLAAGVDLEGLRKFLPLRDWGAGH